MNGPKHAARAALAAGLVAAAAATGGCIIVVDGSDWEDERDHDSSSYHDADNARRSWVHGIDAGMLDATTSIHVESGAGDIVLKPTDGPPTVRASARGDSRSRLSEVSVSTTRDGETLRIEPRWPDGRRHKNERADLVIEVPARNGVGIVTHAGDVSVASMAGPITVSTSAGDIEIDRHDGPARVTSSAGDIELRHITGPVEAETSAGDIELHDVGWPVAALTSAGDIDVAMRPGFSGRLVASTSAGTIALPGTGSSSRDAGARTATHTIGDNPEGGRCTFRTSAGDIRVRELPVND